MVHSITQETFDNAVRENMEEFDMSVDEAIQDTIKEFAAQGADLSRVVVDLMASNTDPKPVTEAIVNLSDHIKANKTPNEYIPELMTIRKECDKGLQYRVIAGKEGAYQVIIDLLEKEQRYNNLTCECFKTLTSLMTRHPDLLDARGIQLMINVLKTNKNQEVLKLLLTWTKECCVLHEHNRQTIFDAGILDHLKALLASANSELMCSVLMVLRALVLDDDIRVEFGKAHEHARIIASDTLCSITALLETFKADETLMNELLQTLCALLVRTEFCKKVLDAGGLPVIHSALVQFYESEKVTRQSFKVLKALAGNDELKSKIVKDGAAPLIVNSMNKHMKSAPTASIGLGCIASITLRNTENSEAFFKSGAPKTIVEAMKMHPDNENVQKNGSWAIRNMVSRSRYQNKQFLNLGAEEILTKAQKAYKNSEYDFKAALRDLECDVDLKEEWTGKGGKITTEEKSLKK